MIINGELENMWTCSGPTLRYSGIFRKGLMKTMKNMYVCTGSDKHQEVLVIWFK